MSKPGEKDAGTDAGAQRFFVSAPAVEPPKGGGALRGIAEKFSANPATGTASATVPIATSPGRSGFGPQLALTYDSGSSNGIFAMGWSLNLGEITHRTARGLPMYDDTDVFQRSGFEDLVPLRVDEFGNVLDGVNIAYGRRTAVLEPGMTSTDGAVQQRIHLTLTQSTMTDAVGDPLDYRWRLSAQTVVWELRRPNQHTGQRRVTFENIIFRVQTACDGNHGIDYEDLDFTGAATRPGTDPSNWPEPIDAHAAEGCNAWVFESAFDYGRNDAGVAGGAR